ncbi:MAG: phage portal protein [Planctomycetes bacterium]|nr:phage portal protein [Planctomycetota bacterium]
MKRVLSRRSSAPPSTPARAARLRSHHVTQADAFHAGKERRRELRYRAAQPSKYRSEAGLLGGTEDAQVVYGDDYWRIRERVRAYERDNQLIGQVLERGLDQLLGSGLRIDPLTSDPALNLRIRREVWEPWANTAECDFAGRLTLDDMERLALRHMWLDGDCFAILDPATGKVRLEEGDRVQSPPGVFTITEGGEVRDLILGVEIDPVTTRHLAYYFVRRRAGERQLRGRRQWSLADLLRVDAADVIHVFDPRRISQTRGMTAFHATLDRAGLLDDVEYAELVKLEAAACIAGFVQTEYGMPRFGARRPEDGDHDEEEEVYNEFHPGMIVRLRPGESFNGFAPHVTTQDTATQKRELKRDVGLAIGLPLELSLLDQSDANFSQARGVLESYKKTARRQQRHHGRTFRSRIYVWRIERAVREGRLPNRPDIYAHVVRYPEWAYLDPDKEASAADKRVRGHQTSPRRLWAETGHDYDEGVVEIAADSGRLIEAAHTEAQRLAKAGVPGVTWQEVLTMGLPGLSPAADQRPPAKGDERDQDDQEDAGAEERDEGDDREEERA